MATQEDKNLFWVQRTQVEVIAVCNTKNFFFSLLAIFELFGRSESRWMIIFSEDSASIFRPSRRELFKNQNNGKL